MAELYNREALEALDDHSEAREMPRVASPQLRLVLAALVALIVVVAYWCIFGTVHYKVTAQGVVFPFAEASVVNLPYAGTVNRPLLSHGATVVAGTPLLEVRNGLAWSTVGAPADGVFIATLPSGTLFDVGEPVAWFLPQSQQMSGREVLCYVSNADLRKLKAGQQVQVTPANMQRERWGYVYGRVVGVEQYPTSRKEIASRLKLDPLASFVPEGQAVYEVRVTLDERDGQLKWSRTKSQGVTFGNGTLCNIQIVTETKPVWRVVIGAVENAANTVAGK